MNVDKKTQIGKNKKNKRTISLESVNSVIACLKYKPHLNNLLHQVRNKFYFMLQLHPSLHPDV